MNTREIRVAQLHRSCSGERESLPTRLKKQGFDRSPELETVPRLFPSPKGEGPGEGEVSEDIEKRTEIEMRRRIPRLTQAPHASVAPNSETFLLAAVYWLRRDDQSRKTNTNN